jgi:hypothetical protein
LDSAGEAEVIQKIADDRQFQRLDPVRPRQRCKSAPIDCRKRKRNEPEREIPSEREQQRWILRKKERCDEYQAPHEARGEGESSPGQHG